MRQIVVLSVPPEEQTYDDNKLWLSITYKLLDNRRDEILNSIGVTTSKFNLTEDDIIELRTVNKDYQEIDRICKSIELFIENMSSDDWLITPDKDGLKVSPLRIGNLFSKYLDAYGIEKVIFMSATILDTRGFCQELNLPKEKTGIIREESTFDSDKSPIYYIPTGSMNYKNINNSIPKILTKINEILAKHPDEKGIIHTTNYTLAEAIYDGVKDNSRLIYKTYDWETNERLYHRHLISDGPTVLLSPSLTTGIDLSDEMGRFQVIVKLPWMSLKDKRIEKKNTINGDWYILEMFRTLMQSCGRSTRSHDDWSTTYVLDSSFTYWIDKYQRWFPKQFLKRIKRP